MMMMSISPVKWSKVLADLSPCLLEKACGGLRKKNFLDNLSSVDYASALTTMVLKDDK
jgi:hypothetical protein